MVAGKTPASLMLKVAGVVIASAASSAAWSQAGSPQYPARPIRIVVPFTPGGLTDAMARVVGKKLGADLGQPVVVDNRPGAGGIVGTEAAAKSPPDGYTLLVTQSGLTILPSLKLKLPFDPVKDFEPVSTLASYMLFLVAHPSTPARTVKELVALARTRPGQLTYGSAGAGSSMHLAGEMFSHAIGVPMTHVPYKGEAPAISELIGGQVALTFGTNVVLPHVKAQKLALIAVTGPKRFAGLPDVPTISEAGIRGYEVTSWNALFAPAGTPPAVIDRLHPLVKEALTLPEAKALAQTHGLDIAPSSPAELGTMIKSELAKWAKVVKAAGIKPD